jgi:predicted dithiol-disulfide oxidoreductase (DUF899 family)
MGRFHDKQFPGESHAYRRARDELLDMEIDLRRRIEEIAAIRRRLPTGGALKQDYVFEEGGADLADETTIKQTRFSELFASGKDTLIMYSFMYAPDADDPCPMCTAILDSFNGNAPHVTDRVNLAVVAKAPVKKIRSWARIRGWDRLRLLSSGQNSYNADYFAESAEWGQMPAINVFTKTPQGIHHFYNTELLYAPSVEGQHPRHADLVWPLWNLFDLTPEGRGTDWFPRLLY